MRRKHLLLGAAALLLIAAAPTELKPYGYVNDFANIIPDDREVQIERKLAAFGKDKTVQVSVVTTPSLDGYDIETWSNKLFNQWSIGHADKNNGLLLVVAPQERKWRIEIGGGLESTITDGESSRMAREILPPAFRKRDYAGGIDTLTSALMQKLTDVPAEQAEFVSTNVTKRTTGAEDVRDRALFWEFVGNMVGGFLVAGLGAGAFFGVRRSIRKRREEKERIRLLTLRKDKLIRDSKELESSVDAEYKAFEELPCCDSKFCESLPLWARDDVLRLTTMIDGIRGELTENSKSLSHVSIESVVQGERLLGLSLDLRRKLATAVRNLSEIPAKVQRVREEAKQQVDSLSLDVQKLVATRDALTKKGYTFAAICTDADVEQFQAKLRSLKQKLAVVDKGSSDCSGDVLEEAKSLSDQVLRTLQALENFETNAESTLKVLDSCVHSASLDTAAQGYVNLRSRLTGVIPDVLLRDYPKEMTITADVVWQRVQKLNVADARDAAKLASFANVVSKLRGEIDYAMQLLPRLKELDASYKTAKHRHTSKLSGLVSAIAEAEREISKGNAGSKAKRSFASAESRLHEAKKLAEAPLVDWVALVSLLEIGVTNANEAVAQAKRNRRAENQRREDESRRQRDEEDRRRRRQETSSSSYGSSPASDWGSSSSSSSDSSFGGFGGGDSGGGGSSGDW